MIRSLPLAVLTQTLYAWVGEVALESRAPFMGLALVASDTALSNSVASLLKEACELIAISFPGVNAWAREMTLSPAR